jgi:hypothetical protein
MYRQYFHIEPIRYLFGQSLPENRQYWTMCGAHFNENGKLDGEFGHLLKENIIKPSNFFGVDKEKSIIEKNKIYYPEVNNWLCGDFLRTMEDYQVNNNWNPIVVNYDGVRCVNNAVKYFVRIVEMFEGFEGECLLFANFLMNNPYKGNKPHQTITIREAIKVITNNYPFPDYWYIFDKSYCYGGSGERSKSIMNCFAFYKEKHDPKKISRTNGLKKINLILA